MAAGRIGIIGGGNMGAALARGMMDSGYAPREAILIAEPVEERRKGLEG
ncbi:MAG: NAD(P)-binding domain-containing protein, partial [bacterium]|nr:NAD(P)-binding domain-containing protein [bacterium]